MAGATLRIDRLLFFLRLAKTRNLAHGWAETGYIRVNGRRIEKGSTAVKIGDIITLPKGDMVLAIELLSLPVRRGPAAEAQSCYRLRE